MTIGVRLYRLLVCYAPPWLFRRVPQTWRHTQLRRWIAAGMIDR